MSSLSAAALSSSGDRLELPHPDARLYKKTYTISSLRLSYQNADSKLITQKQPTVAHILQGSKRSHKAWFLIRSVTKFKEQKV